MNKSGKRSDLREKHVNFKWEKISVPRIVSLNTATIYNRFQVVV